MMNNVIRFKRDTSFRQDCFTPDSFAHPAKLDAQLLIWLVEKWTKPGETILDPMFGSGTLMLACTLGRHVIGVELEQKFVNMAKKNWEKVRRRPQLGSTMGETKLACGDARALSVLVPNMDLLNEIDGDNKVAVLYLLVGQMNNGKSLVLEVFIPSVLANLIPMPVPSIRLDDQMLFGDKKVHDISSEPNLLLECERLINQLCVNNPLNICFVNDLETLERTEDSTPLNERLTRVKGLATGGAFEITTLSKRMSGTLDRAKQSLPVLGLGIPSKKWLATYLASSPHLFGIVGIPTRLTTEPGVILQTTWTNLKWLAALLADSCRFDDSTLPDIPTFTGTESSSTPSQITLRNGEQLMAQFADSSLLFARSTHKSIIQQEARNIKGDARNLEGLLADRIITSPPYSDSVTYHDFNFMKDIIGDQKERLEKGLTKGHNASVEARQRAIEKQSSGKTENPDNIGNLPYGSIDHIVTSPPYGNNTKNLDDIAHWDETKANRIRELQSLSKSMMRPYSDNPQNIGNLPYGPMGSVITSPPGETYLQAMAQIYLQCHAVLKPSGLMILITKNFMRDQKEVRLDLDTIKLCENAGFIFQERWYRELPGQSFWRILYKRKYPDAPELKFEDVLVFSKGSD